MQNNTSLGEILNNRCEKLQASVDDFRTILPSQINTGSGHSGEEGKYVESLLADFLRESLPERVTIGTGFVMDHETGIRSYQVDILIYDAFNYAPYLRQGELVIVPKESVIAAISVKKKLISTDICHEITNLTLIGSMCGGAGKSNPYISLVAPDSNLNSDPSIAAASAYASLEKAYPIRDQKYSANELIDSIIILNNFYMRKSRLKANDWNKEARANVKYLWSGANEQHQYAHLRELLHGITLCLHEGRSHAGPKMKALPFPSTDMRVAGSLPICTEDRNYTLPKRRNQI